MRKIEVRWNYYRENNFTKKVVYYDEENVFRERMTNEWETHLQLLQELQDQQMVGISIGTLHDQTNYGRVLSGVH